MCSYRMSIAKIRTRGAVDPWVRVRDARPRQPDRTSALAPFVLRRVRRAIDMKLALSVLVAGVLPFTVAAQSSTSTGQSGTKSKAPGNKKSSARSPSGKSSSQSQTPAKDSGVILINPDNPNDPRAPVEQPPDRVAPRTPDQSRDANGTNHPKNPPKP